jgi:hypothetical protein
MICLMIFGCKKNPFDYRSKFIGNYNFVVHEIVWEGGTMLLDSTYSFFGNVTLGSISSTVMINFKDNFSIEPKVFEDGSLEGPESHTLHLSGEFESTKEVKFKYSNGGLGGGGNYDVTGNK